MTTRRVTANIERIADGRIERRCKGCDEWLPTTEFNSAAAGGATYLQSECRICANARRARADRRARLLSALEKLTTPTGAFCG